MQRQRQRTEAINQSTHLNQAPTVASNRFAKWPSAIITEREIYIYICIYIHIIIYICICVGVCLVQIYNYVKLCINMYNYVHIKYIKIYSNRNQIRNLSRSLRRGVPTESSNCRILPSMSCAAPPAASALVHLMKTSLELPTSPMPQCFTSTLPKPLSWSNHI